MEDVVATGWGAAPLMWRAWPDPTTTVESIAYEHRLLHYLKAQLPPVPAPLLAHDGSSYFVDEGQIVSLLPLMPGTMADGAAVRLPAARFLAAFHRVGVNYPDHARVLVCRPGVNGIGAPPSGR